MTEEETHYEATHDELGWHDINWRDANQQVRSLQARIVKATQEGNWRKVKKLQRFLTNSRYGKAIAVKRVTENSGKKTAGVDNIKLDTPEKKMETVNSLNDKGYQPLPLRRVYIPKSNGQKRPLGIPTMKDRAMQALHLLALDPVAETTADPNSYGFRKERSTADAIAQCFTILARKDRAEWILEADIKGCFDNISHDWLRENICTDTAVLKKWLKAGYLDKNAFHNTDGGTPQGGIISPVLANLVLDGIESELLQNYTYQGKSARLINVVRYADDFIITSRTKETLENEVIPFLEKFLKERGLELSQEKTKIVSIEDGFDFLGQNIRKYKGKLLIKPSKKNIANFLDKVRTAVKEHRTATAGNLIGLLNPIIRGWANYHRHVVSKEVFGNVNHIIFQALWDWAERRHPNRDRNWIKEKYFISKGGDNWVFYGETKNKEGELQTLHLFNASSVPIVRHVKIRNEANPYDLNWKTYFERRINAKMQASIKGNKQLLALWMSQKGLCPVCAELITVDSEWHTHHIVERHLGGGDGNSNLVMLHPNCHRQVHSRKLAVVKPRA